MALPWALGPNGFSLVSAVEHLMFAAVPAGLAMLLTPLLGKKSHSTAPLQLSGHAAKALLPVIAALIVFQIIAVFTRYFFTFGSDASLPASILSLAASLLVITVLRSKYALAFRPVTLPIQLLSWTIIYDLVTASNCYEFKQRGLWSLHIATAVSKSILVFLGRIGSRHCLQTQPSYKDDALGSCIIQAGRVFSSLSRYCSMALISGGKTKAPEVLFDRFMRCWTPANKSSRNSLLKVCTRSLFWYQLFFMVFYFCHLCFAFAQALLVEYIVAAFLRTSPSASTARETILITLFTYTGSTLTLQAARTLQNKILTYTKTMLTMAIHEKCLRLDVDALLDSSSVSVLANDVPLAIEFMRGAHAYVVTVFSAIIGIASLYHLAGPACLIVAFLAPVFFRVQRQYATDRAAALSAYTKIQDARLKADVSVIAQLKNIKMMGLGKVIANYLERLSGEETLARIRYRRGHLKLVAQFGLLNGIMPATVLASGFFFDGAFDMHHLGRIFAIYETVLRIAENAIPQANPVEMIWQGISTFYSLQKFLLQQELETYRYREDPTPHVSDAQQSFAIEFLDVTISLRGEDIIFEGINLQIESNRVTMVCGPIACGKTTLLRALLGEIAPATGSVTSSCDTISYCAQLTWIPESTIRELILGGRPYTAERYRAVLIACCLDRDFLQWPEGDSTVVGDGKTTLTRSIKQRLSLARSIYPQPSMLVLDEPLTQVDVATSADILRNLFGATGILTTRGCTVIMATNNYTHLLLADNIFEVKANAEIWEHSSAAGFFSSQPFPAFVQIDGEDLGPNLSDPLGGITPLPIAIVTQAAGLDNAGFTLENCRTLVYLLQPCGWLSLYLFPLASVGTCMMQLLPRTFLAISYDSHGLVPSTLVYIALFDPVAGSVAFTVSTLLTQFSLVHFKIIGEVGETLHRNLVQTILRATPEFIATTSISSIISLFKDDLFQASHILAMPLLQFGLWLPGFAYMVMLIAYNVQYGYVLAIISFSFIYVVQRSYLLSQKQLQLHKDDARKASEAVVSKMKDGIEHIRAFEQQAQLRNEIRAAIHCDQGWNYRAAQSFCRLQLLTDIWYCTMAVTTIALAFSFPSQTSAGILVLVLGQLISPTRFYLGFMASVEMMDQRLDYAVRIRKFCELTPQEQDDHCEDISLEEWPAAGNIDFSDATITSEGKKIIPGHGMKDVTISIEGGEKVGLGGYADHGQSSLILAVLRMVDYSGDISIDGNNIKSIPREILRSKITTITEDGIAISGSVRINVDPYAITEDRFTDTDLISMLTRVSLWEIISQRGGLDGDISHMHFTRSHLQLLNLARGALHKRRTGTKIVLIDEATSTLDASTEFQLSDFMDGEFAGATVLLVAQRLQCFETADTVLMMREGRVDSILRQDEDSGEWYEDFDQLG